MGLSLSPEFLLAAACAMWPPSDRRTNTIRAAAAQPLDWTLFFRVVRRHRVLGLVHDGLQRVRPVVPREVASKLSMEAAARVRENLAMAAEAVRLQRLFDEANLPVVFLKGAPLAVLAYGNLGLRESKDIDLLVPSANLTAAIALIERAGYRRFDPPSDISAAQFRLLMTLRRDFGFIHEETQLQIELHWHLFLNPHAMDETSVIAGSQSVHLTRSMALRTLGNEDLFTYLCLHGAFHCWNQLKWLADIGALIAASPEPEGLKCAAEAKGARRAAAQAMLLCQRVLGAPLPTPLLKELGETPNVRWFQKTSLKVMTAGRGELEPHEVRFGTTRGTLSAFLLSPEWRYRVTELRNNLTNPTDVLVLPLPERLSFLYPILRLPLWIWRHVNRESRTPLS